MLWQPHFLLFSSPRNAIYRICMPNFFIVKKKCFEFLLLRFFLVAYSFDHFFFICSLLFDKSEGHCVIYVKKRERSAMKGNANNKREKCKIEQLKEKS